MGDRFHATPLHYICWVALPERKAANAATSSPTDYVLYKLGTSPLPCIHIMWQFGVVVWFFLGVR